MPNRQSEDRVRQERQRTRGGSALHGRSRFLLLGAMAMVALALMQPGSRRAIAVITPIMFLSSLPLSLANQP